jgi:hypothetical protein
MRVVGTNWAYLGKEGRTPYYEMEEKDKLRFEI